MGESDPWDGACLLLLLLLVLSCLMTIVLGPRKTCELVLQRRWQEWSIQLAGKLDFVERWLSTHCLPDAFPNGDDPGKDAEEATEDIKIQNLAHLEDLSRRGDLKRPHWVLAVLGFLVVWQIAFLFAVHSSYWEIMLIGSRPSSNVILERLAQSTTRHKLRGISSPRGGMRNQGKEDFKRLMNASDLSEETRHESIYLTKETFEDFVGSHKHKGAFIQMCAP